MRGTKPLAGAYQKVKEGAKARSAASTLAGQDIAVMPPPQERGLGRTATSGPRAEPVCNGVHLGALEEGFVPV